ncbi:MAG: hypothetical protein WBD99_14650 [Thermodesulfobacteriota bacterium]
MRNLAIVIISTLIFLAGTGHSIAQKVHIVRLARGQVNVDKTKPKEFTALLISRGGSGGIIVTAAENPSFGDIKTIYATEKKELPDIGIPIVETTPSGISLHVIFEDNIYNLPPDAWITFNIYQAGSTSICSYSKDSVICGCEKTYVDNKCI